MITLQAPASKSVSHRTLIAASLAHGDSLVRHALSSADLERTRDILHTAGAVLEDLGGGSWRVKGMKNGPKGGEDTPADCNVGESGTTCRLLTDLADSFSLRELHPGILLSCYLAIARGQAMLGETEKALRTLEDYTSLATGDIYPLRLHGNSYFDLLDEWLEDFLELGDYPPRNEALIRSSMTRALSDNPAFAILAEHPRFQSLIARLKANEEEH